MKKSTIPIIVSIFFMVLMLFCIYAIDWAIMCGLVKLMALCFGRTFVWSEATGIWLVWCVVRSLLFASHKKSQEGKTDDDAE